WLVPDRSRQPDQSVIQLLGRRLVPLGPPVDFSLRRRAVVEQPVVGQPDDRAVQAGAIPQHLVVELESDLIRRGAVFYHLAKDVTGGENRLRADQEPGPGTSLTKRDSAHLALEFGQPTHPIAEVGDPSVVAYQLLQSAVGEVTRGRREPASASA